MSFASDISWRRGATVVHRLGRILWTDKTCGPQIPDLIKIWKCWLQSTCSKNPHKKIIWTLVCESNPGHSGGRQHSHYYTILLSSMEVSIATLLASFFFADCVPENFFTPPMESFLIWTLPPTPLDIPVLLHTFLFLKLWLADTPYPQNFQWPYIGGSMDIFWNHTLLMWCLWQLINTFWAWVWVTLKN